MSNEYDQRERAVNLKMRTNILVVFHLIVWKVIINRCGACFIANDIDFERTKTHFREACFMFNAFD